MLEETVLATRDGGRVPQDCMTVTSPWGRLSQLHLAGNFWGLGDQPRNMPFPEFIQFIPISSSGLDSGLKRGRAVSGSLLFPNAQHHSQGSVQLCRISKFPQRLPPTSLPGDYSSFRTNSNVLFSLKPSQPPQCDTSSLLFYDSGEITAGE